MPKLKCKAVAGAANNQLRTPAVGKALMARGIFYAPDYAINGGGLINVAEEFAGYNAANARKKTLAIYDTIGEIIERSKSEKAQPEVITDQIAEERIAAGNNERRTFAPPRAYHERVGKLVAAFVFFLAASALAIHEVETARAAARR